MLFFIMTRILFSNYSRLHVELEEKFFILSHRMNPAIDGVLLTADSDI